ncbi:MAG: EamA family transporter [Deltaproteobacteria bacterium]|nr:EamA family transporter [Deltaproteobacteria bacterium]
MDSAVGLAIAAYVIWGVSNFLDRVVVSTRAVSAGAYVILGAWCAPLLVVLLPWVEVPWPSARELALAVAAGAVFVVVLWPYYAALETEEASRVVPLWHLEPIVVLIATRLLWDEGLPGTAKLAFPMLLVGSAVLSVDDLRAFTQIRPRALLMLPAVGAAAAYALLTRALVRTYDPVAAALLIRVCFAVLVLALGFVPAIRRKALQQALDTDLLSIGLVATTLFMGSIGFFLWNRAIQLGSVAITTAMSGVTAVVVLAMAMLVKRVAPGLVEERVDRDALAQKALGIVLMGGGVAILSLWG